MSNLSVTVRRADPADRKVADVSVVIATVGRVQDLQRCITGLHEGTVLPAELIVVDQSRDDAIQALLDKLNFEFPCLTYIRHAGTGMCVAQNIAAQHASQPILAVTDDDCLPENAWIERIVKAFEVMTPDFLGGMVRPMEPDGDLQYPVSSRLSVHRQRFFGKSAPWNVGSGNNFAVKRDWFLKIQGCDERLGPGAIGKGAADMDLFYRLLRAGAVGYYEPTVAVLHACQTRQGRRVRRMPYGYGMGACSIMYVRSRDWYGVRLLAAWFVQRFRQLGLAILRRQVETIREQLLMIWGTVRGIRFGIRVSDPSWEDLAGSRKES